MPREGGGKWREFQGRRGMRILEGDERTLRGESLVGESDGC